MTSAPVVEAAGATSIFSGHQRGLTWQRSATSAANPDGATWEVSNLVLADASTFPTSSGVNPMISVEAIAHMNAQRLAAGM